MQDFDPKEYRDVTATVAAKPDSIARASFMSRVFGLMSLGLLITALIAYFVASDKNLVKIFVANQPVVIGLVVLEFLVVIGLSFLLNKISAAAATAGFIAFAVLNGATMAGIFLVYTMTSIASCFFISAGSFAALSLFGAVTKRDLSGIGNFCFIGLIGLIIASLVNMFLQNSFFSYLLAYVTVVVFAGLTAWDTQKIRQMGEMQTDGETNRKIAVMGALSLYLDFINLFLALLRIMGDRR